MVICILIDTVPLLRHSGSGVQQRDDLASHKPTAKIYDISIVPSDTACFVHSAAYKLLLVNICPCHAKNSCVYWLYLYESYETVRLLARILDLEAFYCQCA